MGILDRVKNFASRCAGAVAGTVWGACCGLVGGVRDVLKATGHTLGALFGTKEGWGLVFALAVFPGIPALIGISIAAGIVGGAVAIGEGLIGAAKGAAAGARGGLEAGLEAGFKSYDRIWNFNPLEEVPILPVLSESNVSASPTPTAPAPAKPRSIGDPILLGGHTAEPKKKVKNATEPVHPKPSKNPTNTIHAVASSHSEVQLQPIAASKPPKKPVFQKPHVDDDKSHIIPPSAPLKAFSTGRTSIVIDTVKIQQLMVSADLNQKTATNWNANEEKGKLKTIISNDTGKAFEVDHLRGSYSTAEHDISTFVAMLITFKENNPVATPNITTTNGDKATWEAAIKQVYKNHACLKNLDDVIKVPTQAMPAPEYESPRRSFS